MKISNWNNLNADEKKNILSRPVNQDRDALSTQVQQIIQAVKLSGDQALFAFTEKYDQVKLATLSVSENELINAVDKISDQAKSAIAFAKRQLEMNHTAQLPVTHVVETCPGVRCERQARPIQSVGLYIPGGSAPLVSTALMLAVPANIAQCTNIILCTPPNRQGEIDPHILFAARLCGIQSIYKIGGAQAIAAMAYGTNTIPKVDKIFGPGNAWVTTAKMLVSQDPAGAAIDLPAGPSELLVIADDEANPEFVAADLLSQAEHGIDSQVILVALSKQFVERVKIAIAKQLTQLSRKIIIEQALQHSQCIIADNIQSAIAISNAYAPEHLILQIAQPDGYMNDIQNAGAVFLGPWSPETVGDYVTGSNHVLPTDGYAKKISGLSVSDFMKFINFQTVTQTGLETIGPYAETLADIEGLTAHKNAVTLRRAQTLSSASDKTLTHRPAACPRDPE